MISITRALIRASALAVVLVAAACTEPRAADPAVAPVPALEARLDLSDSLPRVGAELVVYVRLRGTSAAHVASFTERLAYDSTGLRYIADLALPGGATRVTNPTPGLLRSAGLHADGFADGTLIAYRFTVVDPAAVNRLRLTVDELHEIGRSDAVKALKILPGAAMRVP